MKITLLKNNIVENVVLCESIELAQQLFGQEFILKINEGESINDLFSGESFIKAQPKKAIMTRLKFLNLFTSAELVAFYNLAKTDTMTEVLKDKIMAAEHIDLNEVEIEQGLLYLVSKGIISLEKKIQIVG